MSRLTDPALLRMIVGNVIGNAVDHAPADSTIEVTLASDGLSVRNHAPGLDPDDVPRLFERFWRKDASRTGYGHAGLGLSLAKSLASLLGDDLTGSLTPGPTLELRLHFTNCQKFAPVGRQIMDPGHGGTEVIADTHFWQWERRRGSGAGGRPPMVGSTEWSCCQGRAAWGVVQVIDGCL